MIKYTKSFLKKLNKESIIGKFFEEHRIINILRGEAEEHFKVNISLGEAYELLKQLQKNGIIITKDERTTGVVANCKIEKKFKVYGINSDLMNYQNDNNVLLNKNTKVLQQDIPIRLYIKSSYLCDKLSINEWNALFSRYENDSHAKVICRIDDDKGHDYAIIETTLFNVLSKGAILDLKFLAAVKIGDKWVDECLH